MNKREIVPGLAFIAIGTFFLVNATMFMSLGSINQMGPGYFPLLLSLILIALGGAVCMRGYLTSAQPIKLLALRPLATILLAPIAFGLSVRGLGLVPALIASVGLAATTDRHMSFQRKVAVVAGVTLICAVIFRYVVPLPYPAIGPWLAH